MMTLTKGGSAAASRPAGAGALISNGISAHLPSVVAGVRTHRQRHHPQQALGARQVGEQ